MEFVFILAIVLIQIFFINVTKIVKIVRALGVYTFMNDEVLAVLFWNECVPQWGQQHTSGISHSDRRLTGRIFLP